MTKQKSNKKRQFNALKHGAFATELLIFNEDEDEFQDLHDGFIEDLKPSGRMENELVLEIAKLHWRKRRIEGFFVNQADWLQMHPGEAAFPTIIEILGIMTKDTPCRDVWKRLSSLPKPVFTAICRHFRCPTEELDGDWMERLKKFVESLYWATDIVISDEKRRPGFVGETAAKLSELSAKRMALEERLDARIDRTLKRYAQLKTFKQVMALQGGGVPQRVSAG